MEICLQCHLETTSFPFTHSIVKYDARPVFFRPGEKLADFMLYFDHAPASAQGRPFSDREFRVPAADVAVFPQKQRRTRMHHVPRSAWGRSKTRHATTMRMCRDCHTAAHRISENCVGCHMPKRRTKDVVHAMMTDHYIQRRKPAGDLVADIPERDGPEAFYHGEELPYYPQPFPAAPQSELYLSVAQVHANNNPERGIPRLSRCYRRYHPEQPEFYVELATRCATTGNPKKLFLAIQEALRLTPGSLAGLLGLGQAGRFGRLSSRPRAFLQRDQHGTR